MNVLSCNREGILCWKNQIIQETCGMKIPNRYPHSQKQPHIPKDTKESNGGSKKMMNKKKHRGFNMKVESRGFLVYLIKRVKPELKSLKIARQASQKILLDFQSAFTQ